MHSQPLVVRAFFTTQKDAEAALDQLENIGAWSDYVAGSKNDPHPHKVIFTDTSLTQAKVYLRRIATKASLVQVFDANLPPESDWGEFRTITI